MNKDGRPKSKEEATQVRVRLTTRLTINKNAEAAGLSVPDYLEKVFSEVIPVSEIKTKICHSCKTEKPVRDFYRSKYYKDSYQPSCKNCQLGITAAVNKK